MDTTIDELLFDALKDGDGQRALNICTLHKDHFTDEEHNNALAIIAIQKGFGDVAKTLLSYNSSYTDTTIVYHIVKYIDTKGIPKDDMDVDTGDDTEASRDVQLDKAIAMYIALKPYLLNFLANFLFTESHDATTAYRYMTCIGQWTLDECNERLEEPGSYVRALGNVALQNGGWYMRKYRACQFTNKITGGDDTSGMDSDSDSDDLLESDDENGGPGGDGGAGAFAGFIDRCLII